MSEQPGRPAEQPEQPEQPEQQVSGQWPGPRYGPPAGRPVAGQEGDSPGPPAAHHGAPGGRAPAQNGPVAEEMSPADQRLWACLAHVSAIVAGLVLSAFTGYALYLGVIGPLVVYLVFRERGIFVRRQCAEALNFQILLTVVYLAVLVAAGVLGVLTLGLALLVIVPVAGIVGIVALVLEIVAATRANQGVDHRYPLNWRLVR